MTIPDPRHDATDEMSEEEFERFKARWKVAMAVHGAQRSDAMRRAARHERVRDLAILSGLLAGVALLLHAVALLLSVIL